MVLLVSPWNKHDNRPVGLALEFEVYLDFSAASSCCSLFTCVEKEVGPELLDPARTIDKPCF